MSIWCWCGKPWDYVDDRGLFRTGDECHVCPLDLEPEPGDAVAAAAARARAGMRGDPS